MLVRIYWYSWIAFMFAAAAFFFTGNLTMLTAVLFGHVAFGMIFMGMIAVLPALVAHPAPKKIAQPQRAVAPALEEAPAQAFGVLKSA